MKKRGRTYIERPYTRSHEAGNVIEGIEDEEFDTTCSGIFDHSDKDTKDHWFDEIIKDADAAQHALRDPKEDLFSDAADPVSIKRVYSVFLWFIDMLP